MRRVPHECITQDACQPPQARVRQLGVFNEDFGFRKNVMTGPRMRLQLRAELRNTFTRHQKGGVSENPTSGRLGRVTSVTPNRTIQLGLRLEF